MTKPSLIIFEGPDCVGKTSMINSLIEVYGSEHVKLLEFPKTIDGKTPFKILSRQEKAIFESMLKYVDSRYVYIIDRSYISNYVYESMRSKQTQAHHITDFKRLCDMFDILLVPLMAKPRTAEYTDDLIKLSPKQYNMVIDGYEHAYNELKSFMPLSFVGGLHLLNPTPTGKFTLNVSVAKNIYTTVYEFVSRTKQG